MGEDDVAYIVLSPVPSPYHSADSVEIGADCGHRCWIGPTAMGAVLNPFMRTRTVCLRCVMTDPVLRRGLRDDVREGLRALPGTREEIAREFGQEIADDMWERFNVREDLPGE